MRKIKFVLFPPTRGVILTQRFVKRPEEAPSTAAACVFMAADAMGPKGPLTEFALDAQAISDLVDDASANVIEIVGVIKWFDVAKGFGFIIPDNGMADVLLHVTCLRRDGYQTAYEGARIVCEALQRPKGLQAFRVLSMDEFTAIHPAQMPAAAHAFHGHPYQWAGARHRQVVQPLAGFWVSHPRRGNAGHLRPHGDVAALRHHRTAAGANRAGPLRSGTERSDGIGGPAGWWSAHSCIPLNALVRMGPGRRRRARNTVNLFAQLAFSSLCRVYVSICPAVAPLKKFFSCVSLTDWILYSERPRFGRVIIAPPLIRVHSVPSELTRSSRFATGVRRAVFAVRHSMSRSGAASDSVCS